MGEKLREEVKIQKWVIVLLMPIFLALMGFTVNSIVTLTNTTDKVEKNAHSITKTEHNIEYLREKKLDKDVYIMDIQRVYNILDRIEQKLDAEIAKK